MNHFNSPHYFRKQFFLWQFSTLFITSHIKQLNSSVPLLPYACDVIYIIRLDYRFIEFVEWFSYHNIYWITNTHTHYLLFVISKHLNKKINLSINEERILVSCRNKNAQKKNLLTIIFFLRRSLNLNIFNYNS